LKKDLADFLDKVETERKKLTETKEGTGIIGEEQLRSKVSDVFTTILFYNGKPTESIMQRYDGLLYELNLSKDAADKLFKEPLNNLNKKLKEAGKPEIIINEGYEGAELVVSSQLIVVRKKCLKEIFHQAFLF
jgi:hypothetical protein